MTAPVNIWVRNMVGALAEARAMGFWQPLFAYAGRYTLVGMPLQRQLFAGETHHNDNRSSP